MHASFDRHRSRSALPRRVLAVVCALLVVGLRPVPASAAGPTQAEVERAEAKAIEAKVFFKSGLHAEAAAGFMQAFALSRRPDMMFNAARAYEEAGMAGQAVALFEQYLTLPDAPPDGKVDARERVQRLQAGRTGLDPAPVGAPAPARHPAPALAQARDPAPEPTLDPDNAAVPAEPAPFLVKPLPTPETPNRWVSIGLLSVGGLLTLSALGNYAGAVEQINQANAMDFSVEGADAKYKAEVLAARSSRNGAAWVGVIGVGLAGWGAWRIWGPRGRAAVSRQEPRDATWLAPTFDVERGVAGLTWGGAY